MLDDYLGNCITGIPQANDDTEMAQIVENSLPIHLSAWDKAKIRRVVQKDIKGFEFAGNVDMGIAYAYDPIRDIHYFFGWV